jgi:hypothetical protein
VDEALADLPKALRVPILLHYFEGRSQSEVAATLGLSQPSVSRRLNKGVRALRARLKTAGVVASAAALVGVLTENAACAAPAGLVAALGKMAVAGVGAAAGAATAGGAASSGAVTATVLGTLKAKVVAAVVAGAVVVGGVVAYEAATRPKPQGPGTEHSAKVREPEAPAVGETAGEPVKENAVKADVKNEGGKVWIEGVSDFANLDSGLSHLRAIRCVLEYYGEEVDWDWLMGVSGEAFCYYYHPDGTCLSQYVHSWDIANAALGAYGYTGRWRTELSPDVTPALDAIWRELSNRRLVIAPGIMPGRDGISSQCGHWFVVTGIDREERRVKLCGAPGGKAEFKLPHGDDPKPEPHPRWYGMLRSFDGIEGHYGPPRADNPILVIDKKTETEGEEELVLAALRRAVALARQDSIVASFGWGAGTYLSGHTALEKLREDLIAAKGDGVEEFQRLNPPKGDPFRGLGDELEFLELLSRRRESAAKFLSQAAGLLPEAARPHLAAAAENFKGSAAEAIKAFQIRYGSEQELARMDRLIWEGTSGDDNPEWVAYWEAADEALAGRDKRKTMAEHLGRVLEFETAAVSEIEKALQAAGTE